MGGHDGAYKGRVHVFVPFIGSKSTFHRHGNNDVMMYMNSTGPELSYCLLICGIGAIQNIWCGGPKGLLQISAHFVAFYPILHPEPGAWEHVPLHVWKSIEATPEDDTQDDVEEKVDICALWACRRNTSTCRILYMPQTYFVYHLLR